MGRYPAARLGLNSGGGGDEDTSSGFVTWLCDGLLISGPSTKIVSAKSKPLDHTGLQIKMTGEKDLVQLWGLPLTRHHLQEELKISCQRVTYLLKGSCEYGSENVAVESKAIIKQSLKRVYQLVYGEAPGQDHGIGTIFQLISDRISALNGLSDQLLFLISLWMCCCLLQGETIDGLLINAQEIIDTRYETMDIIQQDSLQCKADSSENSGPSTELMRGIITYIKMCALIKREEWTRSVDLINKDLHTMPSQLQQQAQYMKAYSLYYLSNYSTALEACRKLSEAMTQDDVSSHVYNLMGCCLRDMGKPHMALQQYRKAIAVYPIISAPSLFNVSVTYRDLGEDEAEMESLYLLVKALDTSTDACKVDCDDEEASTSLGPAWPSVVLVPKSCSKKGPTHPVHNISHMTALYTLARRSLDLKKLEDAADRYLDLLSLMETNPVVIVQSSCGRNMLLPSLQTIYLETATSLLKAGQTEEALAICDKLLSKSKLLQHKDHLNLDTSSQESEAETNGRSDRYPFLVPYANLSSDKRQKLEVSSCDIAGGRNSGGEFVDKNKPGSSTLQNDAGTFGRKMERDGAISDDVHSEDHKYGKEPQMPGVISSGKKRQREPSNETDTRIGSSRTFGSRLDVGKDDAEKMGGTQENEEVTYTAHAMILQAQCLIKQGNNMGAMTEVGHSLEILQTIQEDGSHGDVRVEEEADKAVDERSKAKRRKLGSDSDCTMSCDDENIPPPTRHTSRIPVLKSTAYHLKATLLIGESQLEEAMQAILMSLHCCPDNVDTLKTHAVLLEKLNRKKEAAKAWTRMKDVKASPSAVHCL